MDAATGPSVPDDPDPERACGGVHADQSSRAADGCPRRAGRGSEHPGRPGRMCALVRYGALRTVSQGSGRESVSGRSSLRHHEPPGPSSERPALRPHRPGDRDRRRERRQPAVRRGGHRPRAGRRERASRPSPGSRSRAPGRTPATSALFGPAWADVDGNRCDTRNDILARDLADLTFSTRGDVCEVRTGTFEDPYRARRSTSAAATRRAQRSRSTTSCPARRVAQGRPRLGRRDAPSSRTTPQPARVRRPGEPVEGRTRRVGLAAPEPRVPVPVRRPADRREGGLRALGHAVGVEAMARVLADCPAEPLPAG